MSGIPAFPGFVMSSSKRGDVSQASRDHAVAYPAHCTDRDLGVALQPYQEFVAAHPDAREAGYSRTQMVNVVGAVVPPADLLDAQLALALEHPETSPSRARRPTC